MAIKKLTISKKQDCYLRIKTILGKARNNVYRQVNFIMLRAHRNICRVIVEKEQYEKKRAKYRKGLIKKLSKKLTREFGKKFDKGNFFYEAVLSNFPKNGCTAFRIELDILPSFVIPDNVVTRF